MFDRTPKDHVKRLVKASKGFSHHNKQLLADVVVELQELQNLRDDLKGIQTEISVARSVGSLKDPVNMTCAKPVVRLHGIFIGMKMASDDGHHRAVSTKQLGSIMKNKVESALINKWDHFTSREQVLSSYKEVIDEFIGQISPKVAELKELKQDLA